MLFRFFLFIMVLAAIIAYLATYGVPFLLRWKKESEEAYEKLNDKVNPGPEKKEVPLETGAGKVDWD